jgi:hypothetical protein
LSEATDRLAATGVDDPSDVLLDQARAQVAALQATIDELESSLGALQRTVGACERELETAQRGAVAAHRAEEDERRQARPAVDAWERLHPQIEAAGLLTTVAVIERLDREFAGRGSVNLFPRPPRAAGRPVRAPAHGHGRSRPSSSRSSARLQAAT